MTGAELKAERLAYGMSQSKLAEGLGYTRETIARWEACDVLPQYAVNHIDLYMATIPPAPMPQQLVPAQPHNTPTKYIPPSPAPRRRPGGGQ